MKTMETAIGIEKGNREAVAAMLGELLADEYILYTKLRNAHWNVEGIDFHAMHLFFEEEYNRIEKILDEVAERIRMLGFYSPGTLGDFIKLSHLKDVKPKKNDSATFIAVLLEDHNSIIKFIRKSIDENAEEHKDEGTADFITGIMETHEKMAWMLRASVKTF